MDVKPFVTFRENVLKNVSQAIVGKREIVDLLIISFIAGGHILLEDVSGLGKTTIAKTFAKTIGVPFKKIQFTPDLLPADLVGINYYNEKTGKFDFKKGPFFSNIILADEVNRATPRTQSSLLEAMEEKQITVDGETKTLNPTFMVLATQNPVESYGIFPLTESQMDRFLMRINIGYPTKDEEREIILRNETNIIENVHCIIKEEEIKYLSENYGKVYGSEDIMNYIIDIIENTRKNDKIELGVSPRGSIALFKASQVYAAINGRDHIIPEDIKKVAVHVLNHRIVLKKKGKMEGAVKVIKELIDRTKEPTEKN
ncbi:MAG: MoxR family ATPase [Tissierellaceae bacterium]|jgi:MoxR-like ATPase|nr:MoxR family ATPase [Tissierellaceae bacterium]